MEMRALRWNLLAQHESLRRSMQELEAAFARGTGWQPHARALRDELVAHNLAEEWLLAPLLPGIDAWGRQRVEVMRREHLEEQRLIAEQLEGCPDELSLREFLSLLRSHLASEELEVLSEEVLRDDVIIVDAD